MFGVWPPVCHHGRFESQGGCSGKMPARLPARCGRYQGSLSIAFACAEGTWRAVPTKVGQNSLDTKDKCTYHKMARLGWLCIEMLLQ